MLYKTFVIFIFLFFLVDANAQEYSVRGKVLDFKTREPLAFVNIISSGETQGVSADIDGNFFITSKKRISQLVFSYVGYEILKYALTDSSTHLNNLTILLKGKRVELTEIVIVAGENPANRIIKQVTANGDKNNPEKMRSFSYASYNKFIVTGQKDTTVRKDTLVQLKQDLVSKANADSIEKQEKRALDLLKTQYLFLIESISNRKFIQPDRSHEVIVASRVSGLKNPAFTMLATQLQSFSFYNDLIVISDKSYLNPISKGSVSKYSFLIEDTLFSGKDTVFIISYRPRKGKNFDGLKGVLYINTNGYALQNVIAEPYEEKGTRVKIQQKYEFIDNKQWFPVQLNSDITFGTVKVNGLTLVGVSRSYIKNIVIEPELNKKEFKRFEVEVADDAGNKTEEFWNQYRADSITEKDKKTYKVIDSIGKAENLDLKIKTLNTLLSGKIPIKIVDIDLNRILGYNRYEALRLGLGIHTNDKISDLFSVGGYFAYGFKDKAIKYGYDATLNIHRDSETKLNVAYSNDLIESGGVAFFEDEKLVSSESYRKYLINTMDQVEKKEASLSFRMLQYLKVNLSLNQQIRYVKNDYRYGISENGVTALFDRFNFAETGLAFRYAFREKFLKIGKYQLSLGSNYPIVWGQITRGFTGLLDGNFEYTRLDLKIEKSFNIKNLGKPSFQFMCGYIAGDLPYTNLYAGKGSFIEESKKITLQLSATNTFETMRFNEFLSNQYVALFFTHNFGRLLFKAKYFQPQIAIVNNIGWGSLNNKTAHFNIPIKTMEKGYFESGILINNILTTGPTGIGFGTFYRYGPYSYKAFADNIAFKLSVIYTL